MALTQTAIILESNTSVFLTGNNPIIGQIGILGQVPVPGAAVNQGDYWTRWTNDFNFLSGFDTIPYNLLAPNSVPLPQPYSIACTKIRSSNSPDYWIIVGTSAQWAAGTNPTSVSFIPYIPNSQLSQPTSVANQFQWQLGIPSFAPTGSPVTTLHPIGYINGIALTNLQTGNYTTVAAMVTAMNSSWGTFGSPANSIVWTTDAAMGSPVEPGGTYVLGTYTDPTGVGGDQLSAFIFAY